jgi:hypothetical protein
MCLVIGRWLIGDEPVYHIIISCFFFFPQICLYHWWGFGTWLFLWPLVTHFGFCFFDWILSSLYLFLLFSFWLRVLFSEVCSGFINWKFYKFENNIQNFIQLKIYLRSNSKVILKINKKSRHCFLMQLEGSTLHNIIICKTFDLYHLLLQGILYRGKHCYEHIWAFCRRRALLLHVVPFTC